MDTLLLLVALLALPDPGEPTNAGEAAAKEAAAEKQLDQRYAVWVKTLSPAEQAWERVLQENLGCFYLPIHKRQKVAGQSNAWDFVKDDPQLPRILLIGDSVSRGYTQSVRKALAGKANVHRAPANCGPTSLGLKKINVWLGDGKWDVIHFNFGIHDRNTPVAEYGRRLEQLVERMEKTGAKLVWASTTPIPDDAGKKQIAASIVERNKAAAEIMAKHDVVTRGFDEYFGTDVPNWPPYCFIEQDRTVGTPTTFLPREMFRNHLASLPGPALKDWKLEGILPALADRASDYIKQRAELQKPFLLYLPLTSPHTPLAVNEPWRGKSGLDSAVADLIMETDDVVGRVLTAIRDSGIEENTLVIFTSDNGFAPYVGVKHLEEQGHFPSGPLRGYKADAWEGGHRVAFIARWPGVVKPDTRCEQLAHQADIMATLADVLDVDLPENAGEDSFSLLPLLKGSREPIRDHAISHGSSGLPALRLGTWKMLFGSSGGGAWSKQSATKSDGHPAQLYDLTADIGETKNLYAAHPEVVAKMTALMEQLVSQGRSTPGPAQKNDVVVNWKRFLKPAQTKSPRSK